MVSFLEKRKTYSQSPFQSPSTVAPDQFRVSASRTRLKISNAGGTRRPKAPRRSHCFGIKGRPLTSASNPSHGSISSNDATDGLDRIRSAKPSPDYALHRTPFLGSEHKVIAIKGRAGRETLVLWSRFFVRHIRSLLIPVLPIPKHVAEGVGGGG